MFKFLTEKYDPIYHNYFPFITEIVEHEIATQIIEWQKDKLPIHGFYRHRLETPDGIYNFYSACADITGFITAHHITEKPNGKEDRTETTGSEEV